MEEKTALQIVSTFPHVGQDYVPIRGALQITFNQVLHPSCLDEDNFRFKVGPSGRIIFQNRSVYFWPKEELEHNKLYTFIISKSVCSLEHVLLGTDYHLTFLTKASSIKPLFLNFTPDLNRPLNPMEVMRFDVIQNEGQERPILIALQFSRSSWEIIWDGNAFLQEYQRSRRTKINKGYRYEVIRDSGWPMVTANIRYYLLSS